MITIDNAIESLPLRHKSALNWFQSNKGEKVAWPKKIDDETFLVSKAKGIYKPIWMKFALSIRRQMESQYSDSHIEHRTDGTWRMFYSEESRGVKSSKNGLLECIGDSVPVGVLQQVVPRPKSRYEVLGLAMVAGFGSGYFVIEEFSHSGLAHNSSKQAISAAEAHAVHKKMDATSPASNGLAGRKLTLQFIAQRQGQANFRGVLLKAYNGRCAVTGSDVWEALEAAHISPYLNNDSNVINNGLLLRADIHTLFDRGLLGIDPTQMQVVVSPELVGTKYEKYDKRPLALPEHANSWPSVELLQAHLVEFDLM